MTEILKGKGLAGLIVILICIALVTAGCSGADNAAMAGDAETNEAEETVTSELRYGSHRPFGRPVIQGDVTIIQEFSEVFLLV